MTEFRALTIERKGEVATVRMKSLRVSFSLTPYAEIHDEMGLAMSQLRVDETIRIVILTGEEDGEFLRPTPAADYTKGIHNDRLSDPNSEWQRFTGCIRAHQAIAEMEKIVISRVNGDAMGFGQSLMFNSDIIVARPDAKVCDMHLSLGKIYPTEGEGPLGPAAAMTPGDGALSFVPFFMSPTQAKEYFLLGKEYTIEELAALGVINRVAPMEKLDEATNYYVEALLARPREALAFTKRILNRRIVDHMNATLDPAVAYQLFNLRQILGAKPAIAQS